MQVLGERTTYSALKALKVILSSEERPKKAYLIHSKERETVDRYCILFEDWLTHHTIIKDAFTWGYKGTGCEALRKAVALLELYKIEIYSYEVKEYKMFEKLVSGKLVDDNYYDKRIEKLLNDMKINSEEISSYYFSYEDETLDEYEMKKKNYIVSSDEALISLWNLEERMVFTDEPKKALLETMKNFEISLREISGYSSEPDKNEIGVKIVDAIFKNDYLNVPDGIRKDDCKQLLRSIISVFRNDVAHNDIRYNNYESYVIISFADLLIKMFKKK